MGIAAPIVRGMERAPKGASSPDACRYPKSSEMPSPLRDGAVQTVTHFNHVRTRETAWDDKARAGLDTDLSVLPGTEKFATARGDWLVLFFRCDPGKAPRVELVMAENLASAGRVVPTGLRACAVPVAAVTGWTASRFVEGGAIEPGSYFLGPRLEDLCRMLSLIQIPNDHVSNHVHRTIRLHELVCETIDAFLRGELVAANGDVSLPASEREQLNWARRLIITRYAEKLTICQIARAAGIGRAKLIRGFRELYGCSVYEMITSTRLRIAATSLRATRQPVSRIAFDSGYQSSAAFARAFGKHYGSSPSAFRGED